MKNISDILTSSVVKIMPRTISAAEDKEVDSPERLALLKDIIFHIDVNFISSGNSVTFSIYEAVKTNFL